MNTLKTRVWSVSVQLNELCGLFSQPDRDQKQTLQFALLVLPQIDERFYLLKL